MDLKNFYKSKEWEQFRRVIINQNMNEDGFVICAACGKPIINKYDLIVHHRTELTEANVNDALIALNPDNVECVHFKCHNMLHDRWQGWNNGYRPKPKQVYIIYGAPCAGKSTWVKNNASANDLVVDLDNIYQMISVNPKYVKPGAIKATVFELRDKLYDIIKYRSGKWQDAYIITGGALKGERERLRVRVNADQFIFIDTDKATCMQRAEDKPKDWVKYVAEWFDKFQSD